MSPPAVARLRAWVAAAARAPSAHNVQPARWRFDGGRIVLFEDTHRRLAAGDPTGRDAALALGMAWEGLALAASADGWTLTPPRRPVAGEGEGEPDRVPWWRAIASGTFVEGATPDPLAAAVSSRRSCRQPFRTATAAERATLATVFGAHAGIASPVDPPVQAALAGAHQAASIDLLRDLAIGAELYAWLRLSPHHPDRHRDGLDAACLALGTFEAAGARVAMRPRIAAFLAATGLGGLLVDEAGRSRSATTLAVLHVPASVDDFAAGRSFYRFWLALAAAGFAAVPMSALVDTKRGRAALAANVALVPGHRILNVLRVGPAPTAPLPESARLPVGELLVDVRDA